MSDTTPSPLFGANAYPGSQIDRNVITEPVVIGLMGLRQELTDFEEATAAETNDEIANIDNQFVNETTGVARLPILEPEENINDTDPQEGLLPPPRELYPPDGGTSKKRERKSYAKKKMLGAASLYSQDGLPIAGLTGSLVGFIRECPRLSTNGGKYIIDWVTYSTGFPRSVEQSKLKTRYDSNPETKLAFDRAIGFYEATGNNHKVLPPRLIHSLWPEHFTCHDILKSQEGKVIWPKKEDDSSRKSEQTEKSKRSRKPVKTAHPKMIQLKLLHGLEPNDVRKRSANDLQDREESSKNSRVGDDNTNSGAE